MAEELGGLKEIIGGLKEEVANMQQLVSANIAELLGGAIGNNNSNRL